METQRYRHTIVTLLVTGLMAALSLAAPGVRAEAPAAEKAAASVRSTRGVVAADHPLASQVGARMLEQGGSAADAGVASLLALGVMNPFGSGLGGGGFCLYRPADGEVEVLDFRERAPGKASRDMYIVDGKARIELTMRGGLAVAVPGEAAGLFTLQKRFGALKWPEVVEPARRLASEGFEVGTLLPKRLARRAEALQSSPALAAAFQDEKGRWVEAGQTLKRPALGRTLRALQTEGPTPFYEGAIAASIVEAVNEAGGVFTADDLSGYEVTWREPLQGSYRGYEVYAMPPPSSGGTTIIETLNILENYDLPTLGQSIETTHRVVEALKHAFADRARWLGDADFVEVPVERLTSKAYARELFFRILPGGVLPPEAYGTAAPIPDDDGTTHVSVIDAAGNMLACTSTINTSFGSLVYDEDTGLILNNEMGDFSAQPGVPNNYGLVGTEQNAVAPGKRPLSSMSPTLVLDDGEPFLAVGASGGPTIITGTLLAMIRLIDHGTTPAEAVALPRLHHQWMPNVLFLEEGDPDLERVLRGRGHEIVERGGYNSVQLVVRDDDGSLVGVSDPRKHGAPAAAKKGRK